MTWRDAVMMQREIPLSEREEEITPPERELEAREPGEWRVAPYLASTEPGRSALFGHHTTVVGPGESIQAAVDAAQPGDRIFLRPGIYAQSVPIDRAGIELVGIGRRPPILENPGGQENGITVTAAGAGVEIANLTVRNFEENGILLVGVSGFHLSDVVAENDGEYGLFPVLSSNGLIERCSARGHGDAGIYVGQSEHVAVRGSTASGNLSGIEIENSSDVQVSDNESFDNVAGVLVVLLPGLSVKSSSDLLLTHNNLHDNNRPNPSTEGIDAFVPTGSGILIVGTDATDVSANRITGHSFVGIGVANTGLLAELAGVPIDDIEPFPDHVRVRDNTVTGNGGAQPIPFLPPGVDLLWDGTGTGDCWEGNVFDSSLDLDLPGGAPSPALPVCT
jgi:parallel beta-helix repeat protein